MSSFFIFLGQQTLGMRCLSLSKRLYSRKGAKKRKVQDTKTSATQHLSNLVPFSWAFRLSPSGFPLYLCLLRYFFARKGCRFNP